jgi:hypothetical protein
VGKGARRSASGRYGRGGEISPYTGLPIVPTAEDRVAHRTEEGEDEPDHQDDDADRPDDGDLKKEADNQEDDTEDDHGRPPLGRSEQLLPSPLLLSWRPSARREPRQTPKRGQQGPLRKAVPILRQGSRPTSCSTGPVARAGRLLRSGLEVTISR